MSVLDRRKFLRGLLAAPVVAIAAKAAIEAKFVPELKEAAFDELRTLEGEDEELLLLREQYMAEAGQAIARDVDERIFSVMPKEVFAPDQRIWRSMVNEAEGWASAIAVTHPDISFESLKRATRVLARAIDTDLKDNEVAVDTKLVVDLPRVTRTWLDHAGNTQCELAMGLDKTHNILSETVYKVGYIGNDNPTHHNRPTASRYANGDLVDGGPKRDDVEIYQDERQLRKEQRELDDQYRAKEAQIEVIKRSRMDAIEEAQRQANLRPVVNILSLDDQADDDEWYERIADEHVEQSLGGMFIDMLWG